MAHLIFQVAAYVNTDTYEGCIKLEQGTNYSDTIFRNNNYIGQTPKNIVIVNQCNTGFNVNAQNSKLKIVNEGDDTLFTLSFYIDDVLQSTPSDIYFIDSINHVIIRPDLFLCDTCSDTSSPVMYSVLYRYKQQ